jgi:hypothetical protein
MRLRSIHFWVSAPSDDEIDTTTTNAKGANLIGEPIPLYLNFFCKTMLPIQAVNDPKIQKCILLAFPSSSRLCKTMVLSICKTMGIMTVDHCTRARQCASGAQQLHPLSGDCWRCCCEWSGPALARGHTTGLLRSDQYALRVAHRRHHSPPELARSPPSGEQRERAREKMSVMKDAGEQAETER